MIKIGDFSKLAHVSIKTLHHYGEMGLLKPAHVDRYTGYRYYTLDQLSHLNRILALKDLGFSLEQVTQLMNEELSLEEMRGMLRLKQMELARSLTEEQARLDCVERRLVQLTHEGHPPDQEIAIKDVPAQTALRARIVAVNEEAILPARNSLQAILCNHLKRVRLKPTTPWFALIDNGPYDENDLEVELAVGVQLRKGLHASDWEGSTVQLQELPAVESMASIIHEGESASVQNAYTHLYAWTQANGYQFAGPYREIYLPESGLTFQTRSNFDVGFIELQCPVQRASIPISIQSNQKRKEELMQPKIITKPAFKVVGMSYIGKNETGEIPQLWGVYNKRFNEIAAVNDICFGLCYSKVEGAAEGEFEYLAATEVVDDKNIPEGMVLREISEYKYAVFTHHGKLDKLGDTYEYIYNTWLSQSSHQVHPDKFDMEVYDERFFPDTDDSALDIYVALK